MLVAQNSLGPVCPVPLTVRGTGVWRVEGDSWAWLCEDRYPDDEWASDVEWESDDDEDDDETRWLTIRDDGWESGHERSMTPGQEGWLPGPLPPPQHD